MSVSLPDDVLAFILEREGGLAENPNDPGGLTNYGITQGTFAAWLASQGLQSRSVRGITRDEIYRIYDTRYWRDSKCASFADTHPRLALAHMDAAVNHGIGQAAKFLQRAVHAKDDGVIGPMTLTAIRESDEPTAIGRYLTQRAAFYRMLVERRPQSKEFLYGWLARLRHVAKACSVPITPEFAKPSQ